MTSHQATTYTPGLQGGYAGTYPAALYHASGTAVDTHEAIATAEPTGTNIRILLVDDQPCVLSSLRLNLELENDLTVVGEAEDGAQAVDLAARLQPDVVLMDAHLPVMDGIQATAQLVARGEPCAVVMLSMYDDHGTREHARAAGAFDFVSKDEPLEAVLDAIRRAARRYLA